MPTRQQRAQSVVEFGIVSLLFVLLMFAIVDFGFLLNSWVRLSAGSRDVARDASVGYFATPAYGTPDLYDEVNAIALPGVNRTPYFPFANYCCGAFGSNDEVVLTVAYYPGCIPSASCTAVSPSSVDQRFWGGTCSAASCAHPVMGDTIVVTLAARGMEVLTPLVRPFFGCAGNQLHCNVQLSSSTMMRYEGQ